MSCRERATRLVSQHIVLNKGYYGYTPLHLACDKKTFVNGAKSRKNICIFPCASVLRLLLECGGDEFVAAKDHRGNTPLHIAAQSDSLVCVRELLFYADSSIVQMKNNDKKTAHDLTSTEKIRSLLKFYSTTS